MRIFILLSLLFLACSSGVTETPVKVEPLIVIDRHDAIEAAKAFLIDNLDEPKIFTKNMMYGDRMLNQTAIYDVELNSWLVTIEITVPSTTYEVRVDASSGNASWKRKTAAELMEGMEE